MIGLAEVPPASVVRRRRRGFWLALGSVVAVLAGAVIATVAVSLHYLHAPGLDAFGFGWLPPDNRHSHEVQAGPYSALVVPARPGHAQTFFVAVENP